LTGTARSLRPSVRDQLEARITAIAAGVATGLGATAKVRYSRDYPITTNAPDATVFAGSVASAVVGAAAVDTNMTPVMGGEDFSFMLEARPGAYIFMGNGDTAGLHHPKYDFNDTAIPFGVAYWVRLTEAALESV
jgi:metal-dependent amidase/aminoacylase/carboxypeptidase family protein